MRWFIVLLLLFCDAVVAQDWSRVFYEEGVSCCNSVEFTKQGYGYMYGDTAVRVSYDNGYSWQIDANWPFEGGAKSIVFRDSLQGFALLNEHSYALTFDGGMSWLPRTTSDVPLSVPVYMDAQRLVTTWLWTPDGFGTDLYVSVSLDSGLNWSVVYHVEDQVSGDSFFKMTNGGDESLYATSFFHGFVKSYDFGATWTPIDVQPSNRVECLACPSPGLVLVTGTIGVEPNDSAFIARSADSGVTWTTVWSDPLIRYPLSEAAFVDSLYGWAAGVDGVIIYTADGGQTWQRDSTQVPQYSFVATVDFVSGSEGWILYHHLGWNPPWCAHSLYAYRDAQNDFAGQPIGVPTEITLTTYPNPFNSTVRIDYELPQASDVELSIFNTLGQEVETLINGRETAGTHTLNWSPKTASGVYFVTLKSAEFVKSQKILFIQ